MFLQNPFRRILRIEPDNFYVTLRGTNQLLAERIMLESHKHLFHAASKQQALENP